MKPTRGRVSMLPADQGWLGLAVLGALTRTVSDSALMLDAMHGAAPGDRHSAPPFDGKYVDAASTAPGRLRVAISRKIPPGMIVKLSADQRGAYERTGALLTELGHDVIERNPAYGMIQLEFVQTWMRAIYEESRTVPEPSRLERLTRQMATGGRLLMPPRRRDKLIAKRAVTTARIVALWNEVDVLMTPALATTAISAEGAYGSSAPVAIDRAARFTPFTAMFNLTGQPAIAIPAGFGSDGLPLSVQLVGRPGAEDTLYSLAGQIEAARPWAEQRPKLA
jgi:amidase